MTSALVALSAQIVAVPPASDRVVGPPPAAAAWRLPPGSGPVLPWALGVRLVGLAD